jgi:multiple sugar transport system substrate-binding protein
MYYHKRNKLYYIGIILFILSIVMTACNKSSEKTDKQIVLFGEPENEFGNIESPAAFDWKQCEGTILNFICEDNINANILSKEIEKFTKVTGIRVNIKRMEFNTLEEKINMEFISKTAQYDLIYIDPYKTLNRFYSGLEDLNKYEKDPSLPHIVGGINSFSRKQLEVCSYFENTDKLYSIPFDSTTIILFYRRDIFDKYRAAMKEELGFEADPASEAFTWEQYIKVAEWLKEHVEESEIKYPSLIMSAKHNSIYTAFSSIMSAYGGNYFTNDKAYNLGVQTAFEIQSRTPEFIIALKKFKEIAALNRDNGQGYTWDQVADLFAAGQVAMMVNWDENISAVENSDIVAGKVGYSILPRGTVRSANIYGGSGIGINSYSGNKKKLAAWMFIVWATSPQIQMKSFLDKDGGTLPTRTALVEWIEENYSRDMPQVVAMLKSQKEEYVYYRPKIRKGYEFEDILITNLHQMLYMDQNVRNTSILIKSQWSEHR